MRFKITFKDTVTNETIERIYEAENERKCRSKFKKSNWHCQIITIVEYKRRRV